MKRRREIDKFTGQTVQINQNCNDEIPSSIVEFPSELTFMDTFEFPSLNDPNHAIIRSDQTVKEDVDCLLSSLIENYTEIGQELSKVNLQDSVICEPTSDNDENSLILAAYLMVSILTQNDVDALFDRIMIMTDAFPDSEWRPKIIYSNWEAGYWIIKCADELSKRWLIETIPEQQIIVANVETRLNVVPIKNLPVFKSEVDIKGQIVSDDKILARFAKQNKGIKLSTSRWRDLKCIARGSNEYKLRLEIDLLSSKRIKANGSKLFFGMDTVNFKIQDKLELAAMDIIYMDQGEMNY